MTIRLTLAILSVLCANAGTVSAERSSRSSAAAAKLTAAMQERKLDAVAARDPDRPGTFVAALYVPGTQLLVVSAPYAVAAALDKYIADRNDMDVYLALNSTNRPADRFFVMDMNADGLGRDCAPGEAFDSTIRDAGNQASFDGNWRVMGATRATYDARFAEDDERYTRLLQVLTASLSERASRAPGSQTPLLPGEIIYYIVE
jgi:hypothetical protein